MPSNVPELERDLLTILVVNVLESKVHANRELVVWGEVPLCVAPDDLLLSWLPEEEGGGK